MFIKTFFLILWLFQPETILVDKIAALVNDEIITVSDIEKAILFYPVLRTKEESEENFYFKVLQDLINTKALYLEYQDEFTPSDDDVEQVQAPIIQKAGSLQNLRQWLKNFNMEWSDFQNFIRPKIIYEKVIREKFPMKIAIQFNEIEDFYANEYLPLQRQLNLEPRSLIEMAPIIEKQLRKSRTEEKLSGWLRDLCSSYKIEIKIRSGS